MLVTLPRLSGWLLVKETVEPLSSVSPWNALSELLKSMAEGVAPMRALKLAPAAATMLVLFICLIAPALLATVSRPVEFKLPRFTSPLLEVMEVVPPTFKLPVVL